MAQQQTLFPDKPTRKSKVKETLGAEAVRFDGADYVPKRDDFRLAGQVMRIFNCMRDGNWRTFEEIKRITGDPEASISAQLRHLRKNRFGSHGVDKRHRGPASNGLYEYKLLVNARNGA